MRVRGWTLPVVLLCCGTVVAEARAETQRPLAPFAYHSDFGARARDGWESFPLAQDNGYDPTLTPRTDGQASTLVRDLDPLRDGDLSAGIVHRFHFTAQAGAKIGLRYRVRSADERVRLRVTVFRGAVAERLECEGVAGAWQQAELSLPANEGPVTGLAVEALLSGVHAGRQERVEFADVAIAASAPAVLALERTDLLWDQARELYYQRHVVRSGQRLAQQLPGAARWELSSPDGVVRGRGQGAASYQVAEKDPEGIWTLHAWSDDGEVRLLVLVKSGHDRGLLFDEPPVVSAEVLAVLRKRRGDLAKTVHAPLGTNIAQMDEHWLLPGLPSYFTLLVPPSELALLDAVEYRVSGDRQALEESRAILKAMAAWPTWLHPWFRANGLSSYYPEGLAAANVVMAREYLGTALSAEESRVLDEALMEKVVRPIYREYVDEDRIGFNTSNWIGNTVGGALLAATASRLQDSAGYVLGLYCKDEEHVRSSYMSDGSYGEGVSYERFDLGMTTLVAALAKRQLGTSLDTMLMGRDRNLRYAAYNAKEAIDFGDTHAALTPSDVFAYLASLNQSPALTQYYLAHRDPGGQDLLARLLWEPAIRPAEGGAEPESTVFGDRGVATLRDGWDDRAGVVVMRAGANFNHNHNDEGSVVVASGGELWLGEAGYADYYKDPSYQSYVTQAAGHNTLLIDGDWQSQRISGNREIGVYPEIERSMLGHGADVVRMRLEEAYGGQLERYRRTVVAVKHGPVLVLDQVRGAEAHRYSLIWHPMQTVTTVDEATASFAMEHEGAAKAVRVLGGERVRVTRSAAPLALASYTLSETKPIARPVLMEFASAAAAMQAEFVTVIGEPGAVAAARWETTAGARLLRADDVTLEPVGEDGLVVEGRASVELLHVSSYSHAGVALRSNVPVSGELWWNDARRGELSLESEEPCEVVLSGLKVVQGAKDGRVSWKGGRVVLTVEKTGAAD